MEEAFVYVAVISGLFTIAAIMLMNKQWFQRERFKFETKSLQKENDLKLKKMARDLGITKEKSSPQTVGLTPTSSLSSLLPLLKNLSGEQLGDIIGALTGGEAGNAAESSTGSDDLISKAIEWGLENPDNPLVKKFIEGAQKGISGAQEQEAAGQESGWV
jgi:hypothetical protein